MLEISNNFSILVYSLCFIYGQILLQCLSRTQNLAAGVMLLKKIFQIASFLSLLKKDDMIWNPATALFLMYQGRLVILNQSTRGRIVNKAKRLDNKQDHIFEETTVIQMM